MASEFSTLLQTYNKGLTCENLDHPIQLRVFGGSHFIIL